MKYTVRTRTDISWSDEVLGNKDAKTTLTSIYHAIPMKQNTSAGSEICGTISFGPFYNCGSFGDGDCGTVETTWYSEHRQIDTRFGLCRMFRKHAHNYLIAAAIRAFMCMEEIF